jgi:hypothetical protein
MTLFQVFGLLLTAFHHIHLTTLLWLVEVVVVQPHTGYLEAQAPAVVERVVLLPPQD